MYYIFRIRINKITKKSLQQFNQVIIIMEYNTHRIQNAQYIKYNKLVILEFRTFNIDLLKDVYKNLNHEIDSITKQNGFLAEQRIKNEINQILSKFKHGKDIHEHGKQ